MAKHQDTFRAIAWSEACQKVVQYLVGMVNHHINVDGKKLVLSVVCTLIQKESCVWSLCVLYSCLQLGHGAVHVLASGQGTKGLHRSAAAVIVSALVLGCRFLLPSHFGLLGYVIYSVSVQASGLVISSFNLTDFHVS